ncbi:MAG: hypothetical protein LBG89_01485 [Rickettsiales bacterium]|jgi:hypothetical protein|nr:hypothetical protein [Rickettsiales bacterium]
MKKIMASLFCFAFAAPACAFYEYPFVDACGPEIEEYCAGVDALGDCMVGNWNYLGLDCGDAVLLWSGVPRDRWMDIGVDERRSLAREHTGAPAIHDFTNYEGESFRSDSFRGSAMHGGEFHGGGNMHFRR